MMLTLRVTARCQGCGQEVKGCEFVFVKRINLGSIVSDSSLHMLEFCGCDRNQPSQPHEVLTSKLTEESAAAVEKARDKLRARRKRVAA